MQGILARSGRRRLWAACNSYSAPRGTIPLHQSNEAQHDCSADQFREMSTLSAAASILPANAQVQKFPGTVNGIRECVRHYGRCYWELSKARLSMLVVLTSGAGFALGSGAVVNVPCLGWTCLGTMLAAASANSFNQIFEVSNDSTMKRTMRRPLPSGRISKEHALAWAVTSGALGVGILAFETNSLVAALGAGNIMLYTLAYTPLKQIHPVNTWVGAVVGAVPPLMGWAAASGQLDPGAWVLASALYFWQLPHFMALSFMCSKDYLAGGYRMLSGKKAALVALRNCAYLVPVGFIAHHVGLTSGFVEAEALLLTAGMGVPAAALYQNPNVEKARQLFRASLLYLPALMLAMLVHRIPNGAREHQKNDLESFLALDADKSVERELDWDPLKAEPLDEKPKRPALPPIAYASAAPFPFLPVPYFR